MTTLVRWAISMASERVCVDKLSSPSLIRIIARRARRMAQLFHARFINRVVDRGAAARARLGDLVAQRSRIAGESLEDLRLVVEGHHESFILVMAEHAEQKIDRSVLLELDAVANAVGSIQQHPDAQRQI